MEKEIKDAKVSEALSLMDDLEQELDSGFLEEIVQVRGRLWKLRLLCDHEQAWAMGYVKGTTFSAIVLSQKTPTLAIAIREIGKLNADGSKSMFSIQDFFVKEWEEVTKGSAAEIQRVLNSTNPYAAQYWLAERMFEWLSKRPHEFTTELWTKYQELMTRREKAETAMGKSSEEGGNSSQTKTTSSSPSSETTQSSTGAGNS
jgi:hypothetical protein